MKQPFCLFVYVFDPFFVCLFVAFDPILGVSCANKELLLLNLMSPFLLFYFLIFCYRCLRVHLYIDLIC